MVEVFLPGTPASFRYFDGIDNILNECLPKRDLNFTRPWNAAK